MWFESKTLCMLLPKINRQYLLTFNPGVKNTKACPIHATISEGQIIYIEIDRYFLRIVCNWFQTLEFAKAGFWFFHDMKVYKRWPAIVLWPCFHAKSDPKKLSVPISDLDVLTQTLSINHQHASSTRSTEKSI